MQIADTDADLFHIISQILCHTLGQGRDKYLVLFGDLFVDLCDQIIDLAFYRAHKNLRIQQSCGTDDLLCTQHFMLLFVN